MYQVSFNSLVYFQRYAPDKLFIAKIKKGSKSVNTGDRVMVLAICNSPRSPLSVYQVSFISLVALCQCFKFYLFIFNTFRDIFRTSLLLQKLGREITL